jgi:hypothetical protein
MADEAFKGADDLKFVGLNLGMAPTAPAGVASVHESITNVTQTTKTIIFTSPAAAGTTKKDHVKEENGVANVPKADSIVWHEPETGVTLVVAGIVGNDEKKKTMIPQKLTFIYNKADEKQAEAVKNEIDKNVEKWNSIPGCSCNPFTFEINNWQGDPINVVSGITHGYTSKVLPDKKGMVVKEEPAGAKAGPV